MKKVYLIVENIFYKDVNGIERACAQNDTDLHVFGSKENAEYFFKTTMEIDNIKETDVNMFPYKWYEITRNVCNLPLKKVVALKEYEVIEY